MISYPEFAKSCEFFIKNENRLGSSWKEISSISTTKDYAYYLIKERCCINIPLRNGKTNACEDAMILDDMEYVLPEDPFCCNNEDENSYITDCHIVYSVGYQVPILYFNIWDRMGKLLSLTEVWDVLSLLKPELLKEKWQSITQGEHPIECKPFYFFHPCNTENVMKFMKSPDSSKEIVENYIPNWLNIYGDCFGFSFSPKNICTKDG